MAESDQGFVHSPHLESRQNTEFVAGNPEFNRFLARSQDCIKVLDLAGRLIFMNEGGMQGLEIVNIDPFLNTSWIDLWSGDDREAASSAVRKAREGFVARFIGYFETLIHRQPKWFDVMVSPICDASGKPERLLALSRDVTQHKKNEIALHEAEETFRSIVVGTASETGSDFFPSLVRHLATALHVRCAFVTESADQRQAKILALWDDRALGGGFKFDVADTPCMKVLQGEVCHYKDNLHDLFPRVKDTLAWEAESYVGVPLLDQTGHLLGHVAIVDDKPMCPDPRRAVDLMKIFAARAAAELKRERAEVELQAALDQVKLLQKQLEAENVYLREEISKEHNFEEIIGSSAAILEVLDRVETVAPTDSTVLILGETGCGKELIARAIHSHGSRRHRPLVKVNCGAIPTGLVESELFGHMRGAFTGALEKRTGRFELADGGTLFLDEVSELPLETQVKLLRVLQEHEFEPLGSSRTIRVNVRIIAASNRDLEKAVQEGRFRADLYYRLNVLPIVVPPLRQRRSDIPPVASFFMDRFSRQFGKEITGVAQNTMDLLCRYDWPGNVRELQNVIERAVVLSRGPILRLGTDLLPIKGCAEELETDSDDAGLEPAADPSYYASLEQIEKNHILRVLGRTGGVIDGERGAAKILDIHPNTLRSRMKKLGIERRI